MRMITAGYLCGGLLVGSACGTALAQNNPGGPPDQAGTANNIPSPTRTPGTFNARTDTTTSSQGRPGTSDPASSQPMKGSVGTAPSGSSGTGAATSR